MKIKKFKKLDFHSKLDVVFEELIMLRKLNNIQEREINTTKRYVIEVIHPAIKELFDELEMVKKLKEDNIDEMVEFLQSNGYLIHKRV